MPRGSGQGVDVAQLRPPKDEGPITGGHPPKCSPVEIACPADATGDGTGVRAGQDAVKAYERSRQAALAKALKDATAAMARLRCPVGCTPNGRMVIGPGESLPTVEVTFEGKAKTPHVHLSSTVYYWAVQFCK